jgi:hypothetical protein
MNWELLTIGNTVNKRLLNPRGTTTETWQIKAAPGGTGWDEELLHSSRMGGGM